MGLITSLERKGFSVTELSGGNANTTPTKQTNRPIIPINFFNVLPFNYDNYRQQRLSR